jgi:putative transposase
MPNHVHLVLRPRSDQGLSRWIHWLLTTHVQRHRSRYMTTGHVWQGRYKSFPIQTDIHLLRVLRYVERNPVRAGLAASSREWRWSSASERSSPSGAVGLIAECPVALPDAWLEWVDKPVNDAELAAIRESARRGRPFGDPAWSRGTSERVGLRATFGRIGRPRKL